MKKAGALLLLIVLTGCGVATPVKPGYRHVYYDIDQFGPRSLYQHDHGHTHVGDRDCND
jgi:hypothetical protein